MIISSGVKAVIEGSAFISLVTKNPDGAPHPIIAGKGEVKDDKVIFGIYKMEVTQKNLAVDNSAWLVAATMADGPKGYRISGTAQPADKQLIFTPEKVEELI
ncbi:MAG: pyridoxamine 5'-phosphate oxidase family protein [Oscillospiraceae bacterium]